MSKPLLTTTDFCRAAKRLRCDVAAIKAVASIESAGNGFYNDGFPVILFERHLFRKLTQGRYNATYPEISGSAGGYGKGGANQIRKFNQAFALNPDAAMKACSWGKFQILGMNHAVCGYKTVGAFVDAMKESEGKQLDAFVSFVIGNKLDGHLRNHDWARFARGYNGSAYAKHGYDIKIGRAYVRFAKEGIDCSNLVASDSHSQVPPTETTTVEVSGGGIVSETTKNEQDITETVEIEGVKPYNEIGLGGTLKNDAKAILPANIGINTISEWIAQTTGWPPWVVSLIPKLVIIALACTVLWVLYRLITWAKHTWVENERVKLLASINSDITKKDIVLK